MVIEWPICTLNQAFVYFLYSLDVSVYPLNKPYGPSYDNDCANYKSQNAVQNQNVTIHAASKSFKIQHLQSVCNTGKCVGTIKEEWNVKVESNHMKVLNIDQTVAVCDFGFQGCNFNPRNLSLWINSTGHLEMAIGEKHDWTMNISFISLPSKIKTSGYQK